MKKFLLFALTAVVVLLGGWYATERGYVTIPSFGSSQPSLSHQTRFDSTLNPDLRKTIESKIAIDDEALKKDSKNLDAWLDLAIQYKQAGDLTEAVRVWKYLDEQFPSQSTSVFNLGVVYHQNLKDYEQSEHYYREAIKRSPSDPMGYLGLHELYRYSYKQDSSLAIDTLNEGIKQIPKDPNMPIAAAAYYRDDKHDYPKAIEYIEKAIDVLTEAGSEPQKIKALKSEAKRLSTLK